MTLDDLRRRRDQILRVAAAGGASNVRVFGSVARGTADERSDVDLLVELQVPRPHGFDYFGRIDALQRALAAELGLQVHVAEIRDAGNPMAQDILAEAVPL